MIRKHSLLERDLSKCRKEIWQQGAILNNILVMDELDWRDRERDRQRQRERRKSEPPRKIDFERSSEEWKEIEKGPSDERSPNDPATHQEGLWLKATSSSQWCGLRAQEICLGFSWSSVEERNSDWKRMTDAFMAPTERNLVATIGSHSLVVERKWLTRENFICGQSTELMWPVEVERDLKENVFQSQSRGMLGEFQNLNSRLTRRRDGRGVYAISKLNQRLETKQVPVWVTDGGAVGRLDRWK
jgi:hypothetical protein